MTVAGELIKTLLDSADKSERSLQSDIGPSEIGGCRKRVWYRLYKQPITNDNLLHMSAIMGTAIHSHIQKVIEETDPTKYRFESEIAVEYNGLKGHVDLYDRQSFEVIDWKTTKSKNVSYFPSQQQRWQVQLYGYLMNKNGYVVEKVTLVAIPRDSDERDIVYHSEAYDENVALEALAWFEDVKAREDAPAPEKDAVFCKHYCPYFDESGLFGCEGRTKATDSPGIVIEDEMVDKAAREYIDLGTAIKALESKQNEARSVLEGHTGLTLNGIAIKWATTKGRESIDEAEVQKMLGFVPKKTGRESVRLTVKE